MATYTGGNRLFSITSHKILKTKTKIKLTKTARGNKEIRNAELLHYLNDQI